MIKKTFHFICFLLATIFFAVLLAVMYQQIFWFIIKIDIFSPYTYKLLSDFWNKGGLLRIRDVMVILSVISYFPLLIFISYKLYHFKYMKLIIVPLEYIANRGIEKHNELMKDVNIKNLKIEEKKTIEQLVQERIEIENKKQESSETNDFRKNLKEKIENNKKS